MQHSVQIAPSKPMHANLFIDGQPAELSSRLEVRNPASPAELVGTVARGASSDVNAAIAAAKAAQVGWARLTFERRAQILDLALEQVQQGIEERAELLVRENGKTRAEALIEVSSVAPRQRIVLRYAAKLDELRELDSADRKSRVHWRPYGVVVSIVPWNSPLTLAFTQIVAALLAGNSVVLKPPESCPLTLCRTVELFARQLPRGLLNVVTGLPGEIGDVLTSHPDVGKIGFTGSVSAAGHIMKSAAATTKSVTFELGGNDPAIVLEDVRLEEAALRAIAAATFQMTGQVCMAIKRIYVPASIADRFIKAFAEVVDRTVVGNGLDQAVTMGPLHSRRALTRSEDLLKDAAARGGRVQTLGRLQESTGLDGGYFMQPAIVSDVPDDSLLVSQEQFCPAVPVLTYRDLDEAIGRANESEYGLGASVWTADVERAWQISRELECGQIWINAHGPAALDQSAPFGGMKLSGLGRKFGIEGIQEYLQTQTVTLVGRH